ncbi:MAG: 50S ribosomal protein L30e [Candidatus Micrarchaeota archaeon]|nr:50S ribosomal protein L30e [Candidatus Micrarchaeota archaeon]
MDVNRAIRTAVDTGKVKFGARGSVKGSLSGEPKLIIVARNCPAETRGDINQYSKLSGTGVYEFGGTSVELGALCGKPFPVTVMSVMEPGDSDILQVVAGNEAR